MLQATIIINMDLVQDLKIPVGIDVARVTGIKRGRRHTGVKKYLICLDPDQVAAIDRFQTRYYMASRSEAIRQLIAHGLYRVEAEQ